MVTRVIGSCDLGHRSAQTIKTPAGNRGVQVLITALGITPLWDYCCMGSHQDVDAPKPSRKFHSCALPESACAPFELRDELGEQLDALLDHPQRWLAADRG